MVAVACGGNSSTVAIDLLVGALSGSSLRGQVGFAGSAWRSQHSRGRDTVGGWDRNLVGDHPYVSVGNVSSVDRSGF